MAIIRIHTGPDGKSQTVDGQTEPLQSPSRG